jgi:hypothetical protein
MRNMRKKKRSVAYVGGESPSQYGKLGFHEMLKQSQKEIKKQKIKLKDPYTKKDKEKWNNAVKKANEEILQAFNNKNSSVTVSTLPDKKFYKVFGNVSMPISADPKTEAALRGLIDLKVWCDDITKGHINNRKGGSWTIHQQLCHTMSEVSEVYEGIRQGHCDKEVIQEIVDIILSAVNVLYIHKLNRLKRMSEKEYDALLKYSIFKTMKKVENRLYDKKYIVE